MAPPMRDLLDRYLGDGWVDRAADPATWAAVEDIPDEELWAVRTRAASATWSRRRATGACATGWPAASRSTTRGRGGGFDPDVLTIGFARRVAAYKRLYLLVLRPGPCPAACSTGDRPIQLVLAGKAHPARRGGQGASCSASSC